MKERHRGPHPEDSRLFTAQNWPALQSSVRDLCWLLDRGYGRSSALTLVGDRYRLEKRQRIAVSRASCTTEEARRRARHEVTSAERLEVDGFNLLTTVEAALSGGVLLACVDGAVRDMASLHGSYRRVEETPQAIKLIAQASQGVPMHWYLDQPVSNSGRLRALLLSQAELHGWDWNVELVPDPDPVLKASESTVVTSDSAILDRANAWLNLTPRVIGELETWTVPLQASPKSSDPQGGKGRS